MTGLSIGGKHQDLTAKSLIMGILNVTPDSFSDGGRFADVSAALRQAEAMISQGADIIDIGGESTRPGAARVSIEEEIRRVAPVVEAVKKRFPLPVSVDTVKAPVAEACLGLGADMINDVSGLQYDPRLVKVVAGAGVPVIIMHTSGEPEVMQQRTGYADVVNAIISFLQKQSSIALENGISRDKIIVDIGIGFGKTVEQNLSLIKHLGDFCDMGYPVLLGASRKSFIGTTLNLPVDQRLEGTLAMQTAAYLAGARMFRVHDVKEARRTADMLEAFYKAP